MKAKSLFLAVSAYLVAGAVFAAPEITKGSWYGTDGTDGTLRGRDAAGSPISLLVGGAPNPALKYVYDTQLDLTWLADWNAGAGSSFDSDTSATDGGMIWANANAWAAALPDFGGGWVLPQMLDNGGDGCDFGRAGTGTDCGYTVYGSEIARRASPLAHMFYDTLGNLGYVDADGTIQLSYGLMNTGPFKNMMSANYWSSTEYAPSSDMAWIFYTNTGGQFASPKNWASPSSPDSLPRCIELSTAARTPSG